MRTDVPQNTKFSKEFYLACQSVFSYPLHAKQHEWTYRRSRILGGCRRLSTGSPSHVQRDKEDLCYVEARFSEALRQSIHYRKLKNVIT